MRSDTVGTCTLYLADYRKVLPLLQGVTAIDAARAAKEGGA